MNKKLLATLSITAVALAQSATLAFASTPQELRQENKDNRQEIRTDVKEVVITNIANRVAERFDRHQKRLNNWIERATTRIQKSHDEGKNTANAEKALDTAKASLNTAIELGNDAVAKLKALTPDGWTKQGSDAQAARAAVRQAEVAYAQVVKDFYKTLQELRADSKAASK